MISHHLHVDLAAARREDLIAEARAARLALAARGQRCHRTEVWTRRHPTLSRLGGTARRERSSGRATHRLGDATP